MKTIRLKILLVLVTWMTLCASEAHAGMPVFFSWGGEKIVKVMSLPDTDYYKTQDGAHIDVGYRFKQITILFIPVLNYEGTWCGYIGSDTRYMDFNKTALDDAAAKASLTISSASPIPFWDAYGGKLVLVLVVLLSIGYEKFNFFKKKESPAAANGEVPIEPKTSRIEVNSIGSMVTSPTSDTDSTRDARSSRVASSVNVENDFRDTTPQRHDRVVSDETLNGIYSQVAREILQNRIDPGLMARADVESNGEDAAKMRIYTKHRVKQCLDAYMGGVPV